jgi:hypothetical protein
LFLLLPAAYVAADVAHDWRLANAFFSIGWWYSSVQLEETVLCVLSLRTYCLFVCLVQLLCIPCVLRSKKWCTASGTTYCWRDLGESEVRKEGYLAGVWPRPYVVDRLMSEPEGLLQLFRGTATWIVRCTRRSVLDRGGAGRSWGRAKDGLAGRNMRRSPREELLSSTVQRRREKIWMRN